MVVSDKECLSEQKLWDKPGPGVKVLVVSLGRNNILEENLPICISLVLFTTSDNVLFTKKLKYSLTLTEAAGYTTLKMQFSRIRGSNSKCVFCLCGTAWSRLQ